MKFNLRRFILRRIDLRRFDLRRFDLRRFDLLRFDLRRLFFRTNCDVNRGITAIDAQYSMANTLHFQIRLECNLVCIFGCVLKHHFSDLLRFFTRI